MPNPSPPNNSDPSPDIEKLLEAANSASQIVAALHVSFMAFIAYLGAVVWGTTHEELLRNSPVKLPLLDVELPLTTFYSFVPWLVILLHFNLLMQLKFLSRKLWNLDRDLPATPAGQQVRDRLFIFHFTHLIAGRSSVWMIRWMLSLVVDITFIVLPLFILLAAQICFLPFHDEAITWLQRLAVWVDTAILLAMWPLITSPNDHALEWWRNLRFQRFGYWLVWLRYWCTNGWNWLALWLQLRWLEFPPRTMPQTEAGAKGMLALLASAPVAVLLSIIAVIPGNITVQTYYDPPQNVSKDTPRYFDDWLIRHVPKTWLSIVDDEANTRSCTSLALAKMPENARRKVQFGRTCSWLALGFYPRNLNLEEARLVPKEVSLSLLTRALDLDKPLRDAAFKEFDGLKLRKRDLRFADLSGAMLPKADLREVRLQGAHLFDAQLQGAVLFDAQLQGADLEGAQLQDAYLFDAKLQGAVLRGAELQGADLSGAKLQGADLSAAHLQYAGLVHTQLQGAYLRGAELQGAYMNDAKLQGASLTYAQLQGAGLEDAQLQGADLSGAVLQGINWSLANLDDIFIVNSSKSDWSEQQQRELEVILKPLLDENSFADFQKRMERASKGLPPGESASQTGCYSDNPALLECKYRQPTQRDAYRTAVLHPKLIELACSDAAIAEGIARRGYQMPISDEHDFGLAAALLKVMDAQKPCRGLAALSEKTRQLLRKTSDPWLPDAH